MFSVTQYVQLYLCKYIYKYLIVFCTLIYYSSIPRFVSNVSDLYEQSGVDTVQLF